MNPNFKIDTATKNGVAWFKRWIIQHFVLVGLGGWVGLAVGLLPFHRRLSATHYGLFGYAFWWAIPLAVIVGYPYLYWNLKRQGKAEQKARDTLAAANAKTPEEIIVEQADAATIRRADFTGLYFGESAGTLFERAHIGGMEVGTEVIASPEDCSKNIIIFGGIGGGKTSRSINPLLLQLLEQNAGALIFDIKTDFQKEVAALTAHVGRGYKVVGDGGMTLNLLRDTTPELAASYLKSCFLMSGQGSGESAFWVDSSTEMARHCLTLLRLMDGDYSLASLYDLVFDEEERKKLLVEGEAKFDSMSDRDQRFFLQTNRFFTHVWDEHDDKLRKNILGTLNAVLSPFAHPDMVDAFSAGSTQGEADLTELVNDGAVFLVNLPMTKFGREGARFAYLLIKLRFMNMMKERRTRSDLNQTRPVVFLCDEYQSIVDSVSDTDFWDKSRSSKTIGIVSMQGVASLIHALGGNQKTAEAILQNFRQQLIYRTEDSATLRHVQQLLGQIDVQLTSGGESYSESDSWSVVGMGQRQPTHSVSESSSENTSMTRQDLFGANDMRSLSADYCLFIGNLGDRAADEVLRVEPVYVN